MPSPRPTPRREKQSEAGSADPSRRRSCPFCTEKTDEVLRFKTIRLKS